MILKKREKILALVILAMLALVLLQQGYSKLRGSSSGRQKQLENAAADLERKQNRLNNAQLAQKRLDEWRQRSLPADTRIATSLYQNWLLQITRDAGMSDVKIDAAQSRRHGDVYSALQFTLQAKATLDSLTKFMHRFYLADHLHQIISLTTVPEGEGKPLKIQMTVEALSLSGAKSTDALSQAESGRKLKKLDEYQKLIAGRNLFAAYKPPQEKPDKPADKPKPEVDPAKFAFLTAVVAVGDRRQAWIVERTSGRRHEVFAGDAFEIGEKKCKAISISEREAEIEIEGKRRLVPLGTALDEGIESPGEAKDAVKTPPEKPATAPSDGK